MFNFKQVFAYETIKVFRIADRICNQTEGDGDPYPRGMSQDGHQRDHILQLEEEICGLGVSELRRLKNLEEENAQLKKLLADLSLDKQILQDVLKKSSEAFPKAWDGRMEYNISIQRCCKLVWPSIQEISLKGSDVVQVMGAITFGNGALPTRVKVDNGSEFIRKHGTNACENKVELDFSRPGKPTDNPFIESFNGSFRGLDECLNANWFFSLEDAQEKFDIWKEDYNNYRPHSSLGDMSPNEFIEMNENSPDSLVMTGT